MHLHGISGILWISREFWIPGGGGGLWTAGLLFIFWDSVGLGAESWQKMLEILGVMCLMGSMDSMDM